MMTSVYSYYLLFIIIIIIIDKLKHAHAYTT